MFGKRRPDRDLRKPTLVRWTIWKSELDLTKDPCATASVLKYDSVKSSEPIIQRRGSLHQWKKPSEVNFITALTDREWLSSEDGTRGYLSLPRTEVGTCWAIDLSGGVDKDGWMCVSALFVFERNVQGHPQL